MHTYPSAENIPDAMMRKRLWIILCSCLLAFQCTPPVKKVTRAKALETAKAIENAMQQGDVAKVSNLFDLPSFYVIFEKKCKVAKNKAFLQGFKSTFSMRQMAVRLVDNTRGGSFRLLRAYEQEGKQHLLFRMVTEGGSLNYHDMQLTLVRDSVKVEDIYSYLTGELLTTSIANLMEVMAPPDIDVKTANSNVDSLVLLKQLLQRKDYEGVRQLYEKMGPAFRKSKGFQITYVKACEQISTDLYRTALENFAKSFPNDPNTHLLLLDAYFLAGDYDRTIYEVNKLNELLGGDPYLDFYRGNVLWANGKSSQSLACYEKVYRYDPSFTGNMCRLLEAYVKMNQADKAQKVFDTYKASSHFNQELAGRLMEQLPDLQN